MSFTAHSHSGSPMAEFINDGGERHPDDFFTDFTVEQIMGDFPWVYYWANNDKRKTMKGKRCRVISRATRLRSVLIELEDGQREIVSERALRRV